MTTSAMSSRSPTVDPHAEDTDARVRWRAAPIMSLIDLVGNGPVLIVAPHPDDETIGCGGLISLAVEAGIDVQVVILTDGSLSHPRSKLFPPERLAVLRRVECIEACAILGVTADKVYFYGAKDGSLQLDEDVLDRMRALISSFRPRALFTTWIDDPHGDHKAAFNIIRAAASTVENIIKVFAYPIWSWRIRAKRNDFDVGVFRLDMMSKVERKMRALACHRSQMGQVVLDDPDGCNFGEQELSAMTRLYETFIEVQV